MNDLFAPSRRTCPVCKKVFTFACREDEWGFGYGTILMCSYHCMRAYERKLQGYKKPPRDDTCENRTERDKKIIKLFREGVTRSAIARIVGVAEGTVRNVLTRNGISPREMLEERNAEIRRLRNEGRTLTEISDIIGISRSAVDKVLYCKKVTA